MYSLLNMNIKIEDRMKYHILENQLSQPEKCIRDFFSINTTSVKLTPIFIVEFSQLSLFL